MKLVKSILYGATLLALASGNVTAGDPPIDTAESMITGSSADASAVYDVDDDHDGRTDRTLILEQSDSLA